MLKKVVPKMLYLELHIYIHTYLHMEMKILGIEKYVPCHEFGSSHGKSRIYRHAYFEDPKYVPLIQRSTMEFDKLQHATDIKLLEECGMLRLILSIIACLWRGIVFLHWGMCVHNQGAMLTWLQLFWLV